MSQITLKELKDKDSGKVTKIKDLLNVSNNGVVFKSTSKMADGELLDGTVLDDTIIQELYNNGVTVKTQGFYDGTTVGGATYKFLNLADSTAQGYVTGYSRFQIRGLDVYACLDASFGVINFDQFGGDVQNFVDFSQSNRVESFIYSNATDLTDVLVSGSVNIRGEERNKGDKSTIEFSTGSNGVLVDKTFVGGVDENIIGVSLANLKIKEVTNSKTVGKVGLLLNRVNKDLEIKSVDVVGFEKGFNLKGVIGGNLFKVGASNNKYGLYTESNNEAGLPAYDATNTNLYGGVFNQNETGVYLAPITQGFNFYGTNIERNTVCGLDIATTAPAGSNVQFFGGWFEANPIAVKFTQKPKTVSFNGVYFFDNTELWDNNGTGNINAKFERCKIEASHINLDIFEGSFINNDCVGCTFTASSPFAYQCTEWRGTPVVVSDGNTLLSTRSIGNGRYAVEALGAPNTTALVDGSTWIDCSTATMYIRSNSAWYRYEKYLIDERTADLPNVAAGGVATYGAYTLNGAVVGDIVEAFLNVDMLGLIMSPYVNAPNQVTIKLYNNTSSDINLPSATLRTKVLK